MSEHLALLASEPPAKVEGPARKRAVLAGAALAIFAVVGVAGVSAKGCHHGQPCGTWSTISGSFANMAAFPGGESSGPKAVPAVSGKNLDVSDSAVTRVVLGGVDVVAYQTVLSPGNKSVPGLAKYAHTLWSKDGVDETNSFGSTFHFSSAEHRDLFKANPAKYVPQFGGFCAFGITNELNANSTKGMDVAGVTEGWPWARDYLGPPGNPDSWTLLDGKLYFTFFSGPMAMFEADAERNVARGVSRWREWFGTPADDATVHGPFNSDCLASSYGPPVSRTCCLNPQKLTGIEAASPVTGECLAQLDAVCGGRQGDNPVSTSGGKCSACLEANFTQLQGHCGATETAVHTVVDKVYCW